MVQANYETDDSIDEVEIACMSGHAEARDELRDLGWTDDQVEELEACVRGFEDFARCVQSERRYRSDR